MQCVGIFKPYCCSLTHSGAIRGRHLWQHTPSSCLRHPSFGGRAGKRCSECALTAVLVNHAPTEGVVCANWTSVGKLATRSDTMRFAIARSTYCFDTEALYASVLGWVQNAYILQAQKPETKINIHWKPDASYTTEYTEINTGDWPMDLVKIWEKRS